MKPRPVAPLAIDDSMFRAGERVGIAVSGGADSVALLRRLHSTAAESGIVLRLLHFDHQLRGAESDGDAAFVRQLAETLDLPLEQTTADTETFARTGKLSLERAARTLRYEFFARAIAERKVNCVATAHTRDDQAETVLLKWMRGAWTEGLGGISPKVAVPGGRIVRPMLQACRAEVEEYLLKLGQAWREDSSNVSLEFTRNRVRQELLPLLRTFNPAMATQLSRMSEIARDEEEYWQSELQRVLPGILLPGKPVRGGGRSVGTAVVEKSLALDSLRLLQFSAAMQRRVLRAAAQQLGVALDFDSVARLLQLLSKRPPARAMVIAGLQAERSPRELRLTAGAVEFLATPDPVVCKTGETAALQFGLRVWLEDCSETMMLRVWRPGDRVWLKHTLTEAKVKEVLQRMRISPADKSAWPVLAWREQIVWIKSCEAVVPEGAPNFSVREGVS